METFIIVKNNYCYLGIDCLQKMNQFGTLILMSDAYNDNIQDNMNMFTINKSGIECDYVNSCIQDIVWVQPFIMKSKGTLMNASWNVNYLYYESLSIELKWMITILQVYIVQQMMDTLAGWDSDHCGICISKLTADHYLDWIRSSDSTHVIKSHTNNTLHHTLYSPLWVAVIVRTSAHLIRSFRLLSVDVIRRTGKRLLLHEKDQNYFQVLTSIVCTDFHDNVLWRFEMQSTN